MGDQAPADIAPVCEGCGRALNRVDHVGTERVILDGGVYRILVGVDGSADGEPVGIASDVDLLCGYCGHSLHRAAKQFFYERWYLLKEFELRHGIT